MPLIRDGHLVEDQWMRVDDDAALPADTPVMVSPARWRASREALLSSGGPLGIRLDSDQTPELIAADIGHFDLIALDFPKFTDGRSYSHARLLRERFGFTGELRAVGQVLRDQLPLMHRCGFNAFEVAGEHALESWVRAMHEITVRYHPAADGQAWAYDVRRRRTACRAAADSEPGKRREPPAMATLPRTWPVEATAEQTGLHRSATAPVSRI